MQIKKEEKKTRILSAATRLFSERDFQEVSVNDIARIAGVGKGTIYTYFKEKEEILEACVAEIFSDFVDKIRSSYEEAKSLSSFIERVAPRLLENVVVNSRILFMFNRKCHSDRKRYRKVSGEYRKAMAEVFQRYGKEMSCNFETMNAYFTAFLMTSYMVYESVDKEIIEEVLTRGLLCSLRGCGQDKV